MKELTKEQVDKVMMYATMDLENAADHIRKMGESDLGMSALMFIERACDRLYAAQFPHVHPEDTEKALKKPKL